MPNVRFGSKADICSAVSDVRFVPIADIPHRLFDQFVGASNQVERHGDSERLRGFKVDQ
jgi:hypothetical protein